MKIEFSDNLLLMYVIQGRGRTCTAHRSGAIERGRKDRDVPPPTLPHGAWKLVQTRATQNFPPLYEKYTLSTA